MDVTEILSIEILQCADQFNEKILLLDLDKEIAYAGHALYTFSLLPLMLGVSATTKTKHNCSTVATFASVPPLLSRLMNHSCGAFFI